MYDYPLDVSWLVCRIKDIEKRAVSFAKNRPGAGDGGWKTNRKTIFAGSFDVWDSKAEQDSCYLTTAKWITEARNQGYITNGNVAEEWNWNDVWKLTAKGEAVWTEIQDKQNEYGRGTIHDIGWCY